MHTLPINKGVNTGVRKLRLTNFRCYSSLGLELDAGAPVVLSGPNGAGKTNLLEAVSFLVAGKGLRHARFADVARHYNPLLDAGAAAPSSDYTPNVESLPCRWAVWASVMSGALAGEYEIGTGCEPAADGEGYARRAVKIAGQDASPSDLTEVLSAVWITPAMDRLWGGEAAGRKRFWDRLVQAFDTGFSSRLNSYANAYRQWGKLLREGVRNDKWLAALENTMAEYGVAIAAARLEVLDKITPFLGLSLGGFPRARVELAGFLEDSLRAKSALMVEDDFRDKLAAARGIYADGGTVAGAHALELIVHHENGMEASLCSTGQQKAMLIAMVLAHAKALAAENKGSPIVLFDEVGAHLDSKRREALFELLLSFGGQAWFTGTDESLFMPLAGKAQFFKIQEAEAVAFAYAG